MAADSTNGILLTQTTSVLQHHGVVESLEPHELLAEIASALQRRGLEPNESVDLGFFDALEKEKGVYGMLSLKDIQEELPSFLAVKSSVDVKFNKFQFCHMINRIQESEEDEDNNIEENYFSVSVKGNAKGSSMATKGLSKGKSPHRMHSSSHVILTDFFVTLFQKIGLWDFTITVNLDVSLPAFSAFMGWVKFPSLGWDLALNLPDLAQRGWLYWMILLFGISIPIMIGCVIILDDGKVRVHDYLGLLTGNTSFPRNFQEFFFGHLFSDLILEKNIEDEEKNDTYKQMVTIRNSFVMGTLIVIGVIMVSIPSDDGQVVGFGVILLISALLFWVWEMIKSYYLDSLLPKHNQVLETSYRELRIAVCSIMLTMLLRAIYIMTISALTSTIIDSIGFEGKIAELVIASILVGPVVLSFPIFVYYYSLQFREKYIVGKLDDDIVNAKEKYRGWIERFPLRESKASMVENTIASFLMPFECQYWYFATIQLIERALTTIFATVLINEPVAQIILIIIIETSACILDLVYRPFADDDEDNYNNAFRLIASCILFVILGIYLDDEGFGDTGDILLVVLTGMAISLFIYAIDIPRIYAAIKHINAVRSFGKKEWNLSESGTRTTDIVLSEPIDRSADFDYEKMNHQERLKLKDIGHVGDESSFVLKQMASALSSAITSMESSIQPMDVFKDTYSFADYYKILHYTDNSPELTDLFCRHSLLWKVEPLLTLAGARLGGSIPKNMGAFCNVSTLILSDMDLMENECSLIPLASMPLLRFLDLDSNKFESEIPGLESLIQINVLHIGFLRDWKNGLPALNKQLSCLTSLKELDMQGSTFNDAEEPVPLEFLDFLGGLNKVTPCDGPVPEGKALGVKKFGYSLKQLHKGGVTLRDIEYGILEDYHVHEIRAGGY
ncbi:MAG: hypothetical protein HOJ64_03910, partial [Euryarchaeota archaeon]|nr:hypothetical protein [Euryarchaeota archaeon]